jgi:hypothetical protein
VAVAAGLGVGIGVGVATAQPGMRATVKTRAMKILVGETGFFLACMGSLLLLGLSAV